MPTLDLTYPNVLKQLSGHLKAGRTESRAFLAWFLEHYYRLDPDVARDCVCDGPDDKGVDGIYVDDNLESIDIFQSRLFQNSKKTLGDTDLKEFSGTLTQFDSPANVDQVAKSTTNKELANLIASEGVAKKVQNGYIVKGIFVTNATGDQNAQTFLVVEEQLTLYDASRLASLFVPLGPTGPIMKPAKFAIDPSGCAVYKINGTRVFLVSLKASDLVQLDGIASGELFAWNVRQSLGRTKVNKEIGASIQDKSEHRNFLLFHNGLTILTETVKKTRKSITLSGYAVVNGCQSLTSLYVNQAGLSNDLEILTRIIEVNPDSPLAAKITHHTNNQNAISARDLQSNSSLQRRLQKEFESLATKVFYRIKRGEATTLTRIVDNQDAARILLAFDLAEPWTCHQTYKLFDELHTRIFARPEVTAKRIFALTVAFDAAIASIPKLDHQLMANYTLTLYFLFYLLRQALETDAQGKEFCRNPQPFLDAANGENRIRTSLTNIMNDLVIDLNAEIKQRQDSGDPIDYKRELKSPLPVRAIERKVIPPYQMAVTRKRAASFSEEWAKSAPPPAEPVAA